MPDDKLDVESAFKEFDNDGSGYIDANELAQALAKAGKPVSEDKCKKILVTIDTNKDGQISLEEFKAVWAKVGGGGIHKAFTDVTKGLVGLISRSGDVDLDLETAPQPGKDRKSMLLSAKCSSLNSALVKIDRVRSKSGPVVIQHRYGKNTGFYNVERLSIFSTPNGQLPQYRVPLGLMLYLRMCLELTVLMVILFIVETPSWYGNHVSSTLRNECRASLAPGSGAPEGLLEACGYAGKGIFSDIYHHKITTLLSFAQGRCEEYGSETTAFLPLDKPDPFVVLTDSTFCRSSGGFSDWVGVINYAIILMFLVRWKWLPQAAAEGQDNKDHTPADFAVLVQNLDVRKHDGNPTLKTFNERVFVDNTSVDSGEDGHPDILPQDLQETFDGSPPELKEGVHQEGLKTTIRKTIDRMGFKDDLKHIAVGRDCASEMALLKKIAALKLKHNDLVVVKAESAEDEQTLAGCFTTSKGDLEKKKLDLEKEIGEACVALADELITPSCATGQAIITFKTEKRRNDFVRVMTHSVGILGSSYKASVHPAPEPTDIVWESLELGIWWERTVVFLNFVVTVVLLLLSLYTLTYIKDQQALIASDESASALAKYLAMGSAGLVSVITVGIKTVVQISTEWEGLDTRTEAASSLNARLSMALITNTVLVPFSLAVYHSLRLSDYRRPVDQSWFEAGSVIFAAVYLQVFNFAIFEGLKVLPPAPIINRLIKTRFAKTQFGLNRLWDSVPCDIASLYAVLLQAVALCLLYAPMYPPLYLITAFVLLGTWLSTKFACKWWYARPPAINEEMAESTRSSLEWVLLLHIGVTTIADADENGINFDHAVIGFGMWLTFKFLLMPIATDSLPFVKFGIPFFQNFDQISDSITDSRILLTSEDKVKQMQDLHDKWIENLTTVQGTVKSDDNTVKDYDTASKSFIDVNSPAYASPSAKLAELMMKLDNDIRTNSKKLAEKLNELILKISPDVTPKAVAKEKLSEHLKLFEEAFWLADLHLVPRTYTVRDKSLEAVDCMMGNALKASNKSSAKEAKIGMEML